MYEIPVMRNFTTLETGFYISSRWLLMSQVHQVHLQAGKIRSVQFSRRVLLGFTRLKKITNTQFQISRPETNLGKFSTSTVIFVDATRTRCCRCSVITIKIQNDEILGKATVLLLESPATIFQIECSTAFFEYLPNLN